jgi:hypothetical protein
MCRFARRAAGEIQAPTLLKPTMMASLEIVTLLKASRPHISHILSHVSAVNLDPGLPERTMTASLNLWWHRLGTRHAWVEQCFIYNIDGGGSRRCRAAGSRRLHVTVDAHRDVALSSVVLASLARTAKIVLIFLKIAR